MNKLILTLGFGILASSAFAENPSYFSQNLLRGLSAAEKDKQEGHLDKHFAQLMALVKNEDNQNDGVHDLKMLRKILKEKLLSKAELKALMKKAAQNDAA